MDNQIASVHTNVTYSQKLARFKALIHNFGKYFKDTRKIANQHPGFTLTVRMNALIDKHLYEMRSIIDQLAQQPEPPTRLIADLEVKYTKMEDDLQAFRDSFPEANVATPVDPE